MERIPVIAGPTASGKTAVAVAWARRRGGHIISADSRQVFRGMDIGTAKPTPEEVGPAPHHLVDIRDPGQRFSAGDFAREAGAVISSLEKQKISYALVGGSGFYINALIRGAVSRQPSDPAVREELRRRLETEGKEALYADLAGRDPASAARIHPNDTYRIMRALEIIRLTGAPVEPVPQPENARPFVMVGIRHDRERLYRRIDERVDRMFAAGLVDEVEGLRLRGFDRQCQAFRTFGYEEVFAFLDGELSRQEMVDAVKIHTRQYAKRQLTWFRRQDMVWLDADGIDAEHLADRVEEETR